MATNNSTPVLPLFLQQDDPTQECKQLLSSLPKERELVWPHNFNYQGHWYSPRILQGLLACQKHFDAQDSDILLATFPKCGTTWLKALVFAIINRNSPHPPPSDCHPLRLKNPHELVPFLEIDNYTSGDEVPDLSSFGGTRRLFATHLPFVSLPKSARDSPCKIVYLCRNPKDALVSFWHFINEIIRPHNMEFVPLEEAFDLFYKGAVQFGPFWDHALGYWKQSLENPHKVIFFKYEDLKEEPILHVKRLAQFLGCPFSQGEQESGLPEDIVSLCSFENLRKSEANMTGMKLFGVDKKLFFRRGQVGDWKNSLTAEMIDK